MSCSPLQPQPQPQATLPTLTALFMAWCAHQRQIGRLRYPSSVRVYTAMWQALAEWCAAQPGGLGLQALDAGLLQRYLASRSGMAGPGQALTVRYRLRLLSLVRRVQAHTLYQQDALATAWVASHPVHRQALAAGLAWSDAHAAALPALAMPVPDALGSLGGEATRQLIRWLTAAPLGDDQATRWQTRRDRCALALQLGAGIGPGDLRALRLSDTLPPALPPSGPGPGPATAAAGHSGAAGWRLAVPGNGNARPYLAPLAHWAAPLLQQWLDCRAQQHLAGPQLFPSTRSGKPWGKVAQYASARRCLADAGLPDAPGGSFRLRHSFALRQLAHGHTTDTVAAWLGISDPAVMQRYRQALGGQDAKAPTVATPDRPNPHDPPASGPAPGPHAPGAWPV